MSYQIENPHSYGGSFFENPEIVNISLDGSPVLEASYSNKLNSQVTWSVKLEGIHDVGSGTTPKIVTLSCGSWTSMPLVVMSASIEAMPPTTSMSGTDIYSFKLSALNQTIPSFLDQTGAYILSQIGNKAGVTITGGPPYPIEQFEVQVGGVLSEFVGRICKDFAYNYAILPTGIHVFQGYYGSSPTINHVVSMSRTRNLKDLKTRIILRKKSRFTEKYEFRWDRSGVYTGTFSTPLDVSTIQYIQNPVSGHVGYIAYFEGTKLAGYVVLDADNTPPFPPLQSAGPVDSLTFDVVPSEPPFDTTQPSGTITFFGRPAQLGGVYDITFEESFPIPGVTNIVQTVIADKKLVVESPLWANRAVAQAIIRYMFQDVNRSCDGYNVSCAIAPSILPGCSVTIPTEYMTATGRIEGVSWSYGGGAPTTTIEISNIEAITQEASGSV